MMAQRMGTWINNIAVFTLTLFLAIGASPVDATPALAPPFNLDYALADLGPITGLPTPYGGLTLKLGDPNTLLIGGSANTAGGKLYSIGVVRDSEGHITGFNGTATYFAEGAYNDGGVTYGPGDVLFLARWPVNQVGQIKPGNTITDKIVNLASLGVAGGGVAGLTFVPSSFPGAGQLKIVTWSSGLFYTLNYSPDGSGTYDITSAHYNTVISGGPEGFVYIHSGNPQFFANSMLVSEYSAGNVAAYEIDSEGNPIPSTRRSFIAGLTGAEGAFIDPVTGDYLFSTFGGGNHVVAVRGFIPPKSLTAVRVVVTVPAQGIVVDATSFSTPPYGITSNETDTVIEWRFDHIAVDVAKSIGFDAVMINPVAGEHRLMSRKVELLYNDVNGNPVRTELDPLSAAVLPSIYENGVTVDKTVYQAHEDISINATIKNLSAFAQSVDATILVEDSSGNPVSIVTTLPSLTFYAGETKNIGPVIFNAGTAIAGDYRVHLVLNDQQQQIGESYGTFEITSPAVALSAKITTDKAGYGSGETATISALTTNLSANSIIEKHTATVIVTSSSGTALSSETRTISTLMPGAAFTFMSYWNTGTYPAGTYPVSLEVKDSAGAVIATATSSIVINSTVKPVAALKGRVTVDKQSLFAGEPVGVSYGVTNGGNTDLTNVALSVKTVHAKLTTVYDAISSQATITMGGVYTNTGTITTASFGAMDYLVVLQASVNGGPEETLAGTYFRVEGAPTAPSLAAPAEGSDAQTLAPVLSVNNAADPNDDKLTYAFEIYGNSSLTTLIASAGGSAQGAGTTSWQVPSELTENARYFWRARAYDGRLYGDWMTLASFRVNVENDPPTAPTISSPRDGTEVSSVTPVLMVNNATDPDSANLTYNFTLALDPDFIQVVASVPGISSGQGSTSWQVTPALSDNTWYHWRAQADDGLIPGPWSTGSSFFVNTINDAPTKPVILSPLNNAVVAGRDVDIVLRNSTDIDSPVLSYYYEVDVVPTFDSSSIIRSGVIPPGPGTTTWQAIGLLDNTQYYIRAMTSDGSAGSGWTDTVSMFVNSANDAPTTPVIANPSDGSGVNVSSPPLAVYNAIDPDRDALTYDFQVYSEAALLTLVAASSGVGSQESGVTSWTVDVALTENQTYYWRCRANDGKLTSDWTQTVSFMINTANDAPAAPAISSPSDGNTIGTLTPALIVTNATDPEKDKLTYDFEVSAGTAVVWSAYDVAEGLSGTTSAVVLAALADNTVYTWRARANDGNRTSAWTAQATFTTHVSQATVRVEIDVEPETLNQKSKGEWVLVEIELPHGYKTSDMDISSIRLEGTVTAVERPSGIEKHHHEHGCEDDHAEHAHGELKLKFKRSDVIAVLPAGEQVPVRVTGMIAGTAFEGADIIRVIK